MKQPIKDYKDFLKQEYPDFYEAIDTVLSDNAKNIVFKSVEEYKDFMIISNNTGILQKPETSEPLSTIPCDVCQHQNTSRCLECNDYNMFQQILPF